MPAEAVAPIDAGALAELIDVVGRPHAVLDPDMRAAHEVDWTGRFRGKTPVVLRPADTAQVAAIIGICRRFGIAVVPQGGNTGLVGGGVPLLGEVVVSLRRLDAIEPVDGTARQVTVGAGTTLANLREAARTAGLAYAVDLAARDTATVGGTIATNAGGINLLRHGGTREQLLGVEAVLGSGETISHLGGLAKDNTGYHLPALLCGSEGTLGIVTAARLRLISRHDHRVTALLGCADVHAGVDAVTQLRSRLDELEAAELFLDAGLRLVCEAFDLRAPFADEHAVYVLVEVAGLTDPTDALAAAVQRLDGVDDVAVARDEASRAALWRYREDHTLAINTLGPPHKLDVTVPIDRLALFIATTPRVVADLAPSARTWLFGHAGDGNIHVNITGLDPDDERADDAVLRRVAELGGSISAEHGIGTAKKHWLHLNRTPEELRAMAAIKHALDPDGILNPNTLLPVRSP